METERRPDPEKTSMKYLEGVRGGSKVRPGGGEMGYSSAGLTFRVRACLRSTFRRRVPTPFWDRTSNGKTTD